MNLSSSNLIDLALFLCTMICAWLFQWQSKDLVWSLWTSSLVVGYITLIFGPLINGVQAFSWRSFFKDVSDPNFRNRIKIFPPSKKTMIVLGILAIFVVFYVAFFTVHFGMFHYVHGLFLQSFFPLSTHPYPKSGWKLPTFAIQMATEYWPFVLASAVSQFTRIDSKRAEPNKQSSLAAPYISVIRMHLLIFVFAGLQVINANNFVVYSIVLLFYFLPWRIFQKKST